MSNMCENCGSHRVIRLEEINNGEKCTYIKCLNCGVRSDLPINIEKLHDANTENKRGEALLKAHDIINGEREKQYGKPEDSFAAIATKWTFYLKKNITRYDVAYMMALMKMARIEQGQYKEDSFVDCMGYLAIANDMLKEGKENAEDRCSAGCSE